MKIRKLSIKNYKVFDDVEFDFTDAEGKTLDTVVLAGTNGCGKTTVLEVINEVLNFNKKSDLKDATIILQLEYFTPSYKVSGRWDRVVSEFSFGPTSDLIRLVSRLEYLRTLKQENFGIYFPVTKGKENRQTSQFLKSTEFGKDLISVKSYALKIVRDEVFKNKNLPPQQVIEQEIAYLNKSLSDLDLNTRLVDLESEELVFESTNGQRIYFEQLSHGEQHLYFRALYLSQLNLQNGLILVDEPEAAFHPTWQQKVARLYRNVGHNNQVFLATHSPHIMASVPPECLFLLHIDEKTRKVSVVNAAKAGLHSEGLEPNRILKELMQVATLREYETQRDIDRLSELLTPADFESPEALALAEKLTQQLGRQDPFILRLEHQQLVLRRKKETLAPA